jgi:hypothetical protein
MGREPPMGEIDVRCQRIDNGWLCAVTVSDDRSSSSHTVAVGDADLQRFGSGAEEPTDLVRRSFTFLLAREPKEAILHSFDLPVIGRYFPEFEHEITRDIGKT